MYLQFITSLCIMLEQQKRIYGKNICLEQYVHPVNFIMLAKAIIIAKNVYFLF